MEIAEWLRNLGFEQYEPAFRENGIDADLLPSLTVEDLKDLGISRVGDRRRLLDAIAALRTGAAPAGEPAVVSSTSVLAADDRYRTHETSAERRQLSVMFCDLVDSTPLSARLDPEDLGEVIRGYQARVAETVARFGGFIALYVGDGVLIYFGWPEAHEAEAERAVRAALAVVASVGKTPVRGERLQVRIGIATGLVVVGEAIGIGEARQRAVAGETPNRAARLQGLAGPDAVAIDAATRQQIGGLFECRDLGAVALKGLPEPAHTWLVQGESGVASRFEALRASRLTPLIGREEELDLLLRRWRQAVRGEGKVVLLSGEPGIGKSRLVAALEERLQGEACTRLRYFCSPHHQESPFHPIIGQLERVAGFTRGDTGAEKLGKLQALLAATTTSDEDVVLLADLLSLSTEGVLPAFNLSLHQRKERTLEALVHQLEVLARAAPVLMLLEDAHWADPSSRELFGLVVERLAEQPVFLVMTFRPEFQAPWIGRAGLSLVTLSRFDRRETAAMAAEIAARALPAGLIERIIAQTDGVPLFVEELTRAVLDAGLENASRLAVPDTLQALLMARLDRLPAAKTVAQVGAVIGRLFSYELIAATSQIPEPALSEGLAQLVGSGLAFQRGELPEASYTFKHALVQDTVYQSLLRSRRTVIHARVVEALLQEEQGIDKADPGLLAHHCEQGGLVARAIDYYTRDGRQSGARGAFVEARKHFSSALRLIATLPEGAQRDEMELDCLTKLYEFVAYQQGFTAPEAAELNRRIKALSQRLGGRPAAVNAFAHELTNLMHRSETKRLLEEADKLLRLSQEEGDAYGRIVGHLHVGSAEMLIGKLAQAATNLAEVLSLSALSMKPEDGRLEHEDVQFFLTDICKTARTWLAFIECWSGHPDRALSHSSAAVEQASRTHDLIYLIEARTKRAELLAFLGKLPELESLVGQLTELTRKHGFTFFGARVMIMRGYVALRRGDTVGGRVLIGEGQADWAATGSLMWVSRQLALLAEANRRLGDAGEAMRLLDRAMELTERTGERWYVAELHRHIGETHRQHGDDAAAAACFDRALAVARSQNAKLWELQAATSSARLLRDQGKAAEAHALLAPIHAWFTEGFDTEPVRDAEAVLRDLTRNCPRH